MSSCTDEVAAFLKEFKHVAFDEGEFFIVNRVENNRDMVALGFTRRNCADEIADLSAADYCEGPEPDLDRGGEVWIFGKRIEGREVYIKLKVAETDWGKIAKVISFHFARHPLDYPLR